MRKKLFKKITTFIMTVAMIAGLGAANPAGQAQTAEAAGTALQNPRKIVGKGTTYDCVYFGSYPQAEVITTAMSKNYTPVKSQYLETGDLIIDDNVYQALTKATNWDANGDIELNGEKYRRIKVRDTNYPCIDNDYKTMAHYNWAGNNNYHYFKYQPIKWRVLSTDGKEALLLSDRGLDDQLYNEVSDDVTWETCTIRSWLNGYGSAKNKQGINYTTKNFINCAFNSQEKNAIITKTLVNNNNPACTASGGNSTADKVFLLSYDDTVNSNYGFNEIGSTSDKARCMKQSMYGRAMGIWWEPDKNGSDLDYKNCCWWWIRSPGELNNVAASVADMGFVSGVAGWDVDTNDNAVVPAVYINLSYSNLYTYAGTSNWYENNADASSSGQLVQNISISGSSKTLMAGEKLKLTATVKPDNAANKSLAWTSSNTLYATVDNNGVVTTKLDGVGKTVVITARATDRSGVSATYAIKLTQAAQTIKAKNITKAYGAKAFSLGARTNGDGKLTYKSSNTKVAKINKNGKVTITGCGRTKITIKASKTAKYNATSKTVTITVKPKKEKITSLKSSKPETLTVGWKKDTKATGYRIQYSTDKNFKKNVKTVWVKKNTITNKTITKLKAGKRYYVRVAAVKKVGAQKFIGANSTVKNIKVKK
ncbi:MAG: DUF6273 domain-containing protein [Coprococcus sp.]